MKLLEKKPLAYFPGNEITYYITVQSAAMESQGIRRDIYFRQISVLARTPFILILFCS